MRITDVTFFQEWLADVADDALQEATTCNSCATRAKRSSWRSWLWWAWRASRFTSGGFRKLCRSGSLIPVKYHALRALRDSESGSVSHVASWNLNVNVRITRETWWDLARDAIRNSASRSVVSNAGRADERRRRRRCCRRRRSGHQEPGRRRRGFRVCEPAAPDAEPADRLRRDLPDHPHADVLRVDDAPHAADAVALPEHQPGCAGHQRVLGIGVLHDLPPEPEPEHALTLHDHSQP